MPLNPWVQYVWEAWFCAYSSWWVKRESVCIGYDTEESLYTEPCPQYKDFLIALSPTWSVHGS